MNDADRKLSEQGSVERISPQGEVKPNGGAHAGDPFKAPVPEILSSADFVKGFVPPDYVLRGVLRRGSIYSCTAKTGDGKTAVMMRLMASIALGRKFAGREVKQGRCLMLVGENPDDVRARWIAMGERMGFFPDEIDVHFIAGVFPLDELLRLVERKAEQFGGFSQVTIDTAAAYFPGDDENDNKAFGDYARTLRRITMFSGKPCVVVNCHPPKNTPDSLMPRGGGAYLNEMDGNLTCKMQDETITALHWKHKFRGPDFEPMSFAIIVIADCDKLKDTDGIHLPTVIATPVSEDELARHEITLTAELERLIRAMHEDRGASVADLCKKLGWMTSTNQPHKSKAHRRIGVLEEGKLVTKELKNWVLTPKGEKAAKAASKRAEK